MQNLWGAAETEQGPLQPKGERRGLERDAQGNRASSQPGILKGWEPEDGTGDWPRKWPLCSVQVLEAR